MAAFAAWREKLGPALIEPEQDREAGEGQTAAVGHGSSGPGGGSLAHGWSAMSILALCRCERGYGRASAGAGVGAGAAGDRDGRPVRALRHDPLRAERAAGELDLDRAERAVADEGADGALESAGVAADRVSEAEAVALARPAHGLEADAPVELRDEVQLPAACRRRARRCGDRRCDGDCSRDEQKSGRPSFTALDERRTFELSCVMRLLLLGLFGSIDGRRGLARIDIWRPGDRRLSRAGSGGARWRRGAAGAGSRAGALYGRMISIWPASSRRAQIRSVVRMRAPRRRPSARQARSPSERPSALVRGRSSAIVTQS